jgi:hypothetical protein
MTMAVLCVQSSGKGGRPQATRSATRIVYPLKGILKERKPPHWSRIQGPSMTRLTQEAFAPLHEALVGSPMVTGMTS